ncbi:MAG: uracil-DNA glycosylase [Myxococcota bacterium]|nr:uracil-DNA glycosylase [Myxococcota bacterium]
MRTCARCEGVVGPAVIAAPVVSRIYALGQAPGPHEARKGRPFAHTAGKRLFEWMATIGVDEATYRERVYMAAVARCFPGKGKGQGDRLPSKDEIERCRPFVAREVELLRPELVVPIGKLAIAEVLGAPIAKLEDVIGKATRARFSGRDVDVIALPHPSGLSSWPKIEPGKTLLAEALARIADHPTWRETFR